MCKSFKIIFICFLAIFSSCYSKKNINHHPKILVFSATKGYRHSSIEAGKIALLKMGYKKNWRVDTTEQANKFTEANLKQYKVVIFLNTSGNILNEEQQNAFEKYIHSGGAFIGIHAAADTEYDWPWYNELVGAYFESHPQPQKALFKVVSKKHQAVNFMPDSLRREEEIYNFKSFKKELVTVLITVDEKSYTGGTMHSLHPIAWFHKYNGGKAFYTEWGHSSQSFSEENFLQHIEGAIKWAILR